MNIEDLCKNLKTGTIAYIFIFTHLFVSVCEASACRAIVLINILLGYLSTVIAF